MITQHGPRWLIGCALLATACGRVDLSADADGGVSYRPTAPQVGAAAAAAAYDRLIPSAPGPDSPCPATPPADATACDDPGLACEYGTRDDTECNVLATCTGSRPRWHTAQPLADCAKPPMPTSVCAGLNLRPEVTDAPCTTEGAYGTCIYQEGIGFERCACHRDRDGAPRKLCRSNTAPADCPSPRPRLGAACPYPSQVCDYGKCFFDDEHIAGHRLRCSNGVWTDMVVDCNAR